jgi:hypothetical protein
VVSPGHGNCSSAMVWGWCGLAPRIPVLEVWSQCGEPLRGGTQWEVIGGAALRRG